jgi:hypothetical protein
MILIKVAEREGFEPSVPPVSSTRDFQSRSFGQLGHLSEKIHPFSFKKK